MRVRVPSPPTPNNGQKQTGVCVVKKHRGKYFTKHHILPKSRYPELAHASENIKYITREQHEAWNYLWGGDATPYEVLRHLLDPEFFVPDHKQTAWVTIFGQGCDKIKAALTVLTDWTGPEPPRQPAA